MRTAPLLLAVTVLLALAGCVPSDPRATALPSASATPVFASDAEALAAAEKAYAAYLKVSDEIAQDGGLDPERLSNVATGQLVKDDLDGFGTFRTNGWHSSGGSQISGFVLQSTDLGGSLSRGTTVAAYVCEDLSGVDVIDKSGTSVVSASRPDMQVFQVDFVMVGVKLFPSSREVWAGSNPCD